jgi:hypothetical protein
MAKQTEGRPQLALCWVGWLVRVWHVLRVVAIVVALLSPLNDTVAKRQQLARAQATVLGQSKENALKYYRRQIRSVLKLCPDT